MNIAQNIKRLRRQADLTQEQLADILCVSFQSVSKWERGETMPDIALLPTIARFFNTTVDALLNMDEEYQKQASKELIEILLSGTNDFFTEIALLREHVRKYPLDWEIQIKLNWYIFSYELPDERINKRETIEILQRVVEYCEDMNLKARAIDFLVCAIAHFGDEIMDKNKLDKLINSLPTARYSREMIALSANKKDKKSAFNAAKAHIEVLSEVLILLEIYSSTEEEKLKVNETKIALENLNKYLMN